MRNNFENKRTENDRSKAKVTRFDPSTLGLLRLHELKEHQMYKNLDTQYDVAAGFKDWFADFDQLEAAELRQKQLAKSIK